MIGSSLSVLSKIAKVWKNICYQFFGKLQNFVRNANCTELDPWVKIQKWTYYEHVSYQFLIINSKNCISASEHTYQIEAKEKRWIQVCQ